MAKRSPSGALHRRSARARRTGVPSRGRAAEVAAALLVVAGLAAVVTWKLGRPGALEDLRVYRLAGQLVVGTVARGDGLYGAEFGLAEAVRPFTYPPVAALLAVPLGVLPLTVVAVAWTAASLVALAWLVRVSFGPLLRRLAPARRAVVYAVVLVLAAVAVPVSDHLYFAQVGLFLAVMCVADLTGRTRLPQGALVGLATGLKLVPGLFVVQLLVTGRRRAARTAVLVLLGTVAVGFVALPADSARFWTSVAWGGQRVGYDDEYRNQSVRGMADHLLPDPWVTPVWLLGAAAVLAVWVVAVRRAHRAGDDLLGVALTGVASLLVSPVSWIHHAVWLVVAAGVLAGDLRSSRRRAALGMLLLVVLVPWPRLGVPLLADSYTVLYAGVLGALAVLAARASGDERVATERRSAPAVPPA